MRISLVQKFTRWFKLNFNEVNTVDENKVKSTDLNIMIVNKRSLESGKWSLTKRRRFDDKTNSPN